MLDNKNYMNFLLILEKDKKNFEEIFLGQIFLGEFWIYLFEIEFFWALYDYIILQEYP